MSERTHGWCPGCREEVPVNRSTGECLFCDTETLLRPPRRRGNYNASHPRPGLKPVRFTETELRRLHDLHLQDASVSELARRIFERKGLASPDSARTIIVREWRMIGLEPRPRIEMLKIALSGTDAPTNGFRRCEGVVRNTGRGMRQGKRCRKGADGGSRFCWMHDPDKVDLVEAAGQRMREGLAAKEADEHA